MLAAEAGPPFLLRRRAYGSATADGAIEPMAGYEKKGLPPPSADPRIQAIANALWYNRNS